MKQEQREQDKKPLTLESLRRFLQEETPTTETRQAVVRFLSLLQERVHERFGMVQSHIGPMRPSSERSRRVARLTIFLAPGILPTKKGGGTGHDLMLTVIFSPQRLWWGLYAWGPREEVQRLKEAFETLNLIRDSDTVIVQEGDFVYAKDVWAGGGYFALGDALGSHDLSDFKTPEALATHIVDRLTEYYERVHPVIKDLYTLMGRPGHPTTQDTPRHPGKAQQDTPVAGQVYANSVRGRRLMAGLIHSLRAQGLYFTRWQIATFYTALQTKGFVILSGISGTGKTKLAQHFATLLPQPCALAEDDETTAELLTLTVQPYMVKYARLIVPKRATRLFIPPKAGQGVDVNVVFRGGTTRCRFVHASYDSNDYLLLLLRDHARSWFLSSFQVGDTLFLAPLTNAEGELAGFRLFTKEELKARKPGKHGRNWLFVPVRPDWQDSKSLLGYYNPLTNRYHWTPFLRFVLQAAHSYRQNEGLAWFVILDEMNLARVEYYFGDLLSVLESGRNAEGWTNEPLRFIYPEDAEGDVPPREVFLPPNLYIVGTINVDETTHALSPKVLDRAFTLELTEANFRTYLITPESNAHPQAPLDPHALLHSFSQGGRFTRIEKGAIAKFIRVHPEVRDQLHTLYQALHPYDLHFGYRVFDEIVTFLVAAEHNGLYEELGGLQAALDAAVLMKVLPKLHGGRSKLEGPLQRVLAWCLSPEKPDEERVTTALEEALRGQDVGTALGHAFEALGTFAMPHTAEKVRRMLWHLYTTGFAAF